MKNAYDEPSDESFHTMRKAVQWHWRQMSLLARAWPDEFAVRVTAARELSQMLGDDHDLAMLIDVATRADRHVRRGEGSRSSRYVCIASSGCATTAESRAKRLFAETPQAFTSEWPRTGAIAGRSIRVGMHCRSRAPKLQSDRRDAPVKPEIRRR